MFNPRKIQFAPVESPPWVQARDALYGGRRIATLVLDAALFAESPLDDVEPFYRDELDRLVGAGELDASAPALLVYAWTAPAEGVWTGTAGASRWLEFPSLAARRRGE